MNRRGYTLLEVLVATTIMAIAVAGLLSSLSVSLRHASRLTERDRAALLAKRKMDDFLTAARVPLDTVLEGVWEPALTGGVPSGWRARATLFEAPPNAGPGTPVLERIEMEVWWKVGESRRSFTLEAYRRGVMLAPAAVAAAP